MKASPLPPPPPLPLRHQQTNVAILIVLSLISMLYVAAYQFHWLPRLGCPVFRDGCRVVADAAFARAFGGVPDALLAVAAYALLLLLVLSSREPSRALRILTFVVALVLVLGNGWDMLNMMQLGRFCFWRTVTAGLSVPIVTALAPARR